MKKIRSLINFIYISGIIIFSTVTIIMLAQIIKKGSDIYFQERNSQPIEQPNILDEKEIEKTIDEFKKYKLI